MSTLEPGVPAKAERHLAAILASDIVGYSSKMEKDEVGTLGRLQDLSRNLIEPKVVEHRGRIFKTMGDGFLAEFVSVLEAVHCAVDIQRLMAARNLDLPQESRVLLRMGINLGDVFHEGGDVFGDGVNIAARLESLAPPGGIYISRAACDPIRDRLAFDFEDLGEYQVKNITRPIHIFGVRIEGATEGEAEAPLGGRKAPRQWRKSLWIVGVILALMLAIPGWILVRSYGLLGPSSHQVSVAPVEPVQAPPVNPASTASELPQGTGDSELVFWLSISASNNPADFEEYLRKYPEGRFTGLARNRVVALQTPPPPPAATAPAPAAPPSPSDLVPIENDASLTDDQRREVQRALRVLGHYQGEPDGGFGAGTQSAIRQFQAFLGSPETGTLTAAERKTLLDMARRLAALFDQPATSPQGIAAASVKATSDRYARGYNFETGKGVKGNLAEAAYWYALAAADGDPKALINLGRLLARGWGDTKPDPADAALLWWAGAARGEASAMFNEGVLYERGMGVTLDLARARAWYQRASTLNDAHARDALNRLGP